MNYADQMLQYFDGGKNWVQGSYHMGEKACLVGGVENIMLARSGLDRSNPPGNMGLIEPLFSQERIVAHRKLIRIILQEFPDRISHDYIPYFNDHAKTTWPDVELVLKKLSVQLNEEEGAST